MADRDITSKEARKKAGSAMGAGSAPWWTLPVAAGAGAYAGFQLGSGVIKKKGIRAGRRDAMKGIAAAASGPKELADFLLGAGVEGFKDHARDAMRAKHLTMLWQIHMAGGTPHPVLYSPDSVRRPSIRWDPIQAWLRFGDEGKAEKAKIEGLRKELEAQYEQAQIDDPKFGERETQSARDIKVINDAQKKKSAAAKAALVKRAANRMKGMKDEYGSKGADKGGDKKPPDKKPPDKKPPSGPAIDPESGKPMPEGPYTPIVGHEPLGPGDGGVRGGAGGGGGDRPDVPPGASGDPNHWEDLALTRAKLDALEDAIKSGRPLDREVLTQVSMNEQIRANRVPPSLQELRDMKIGFDVQATMPIEASYQAEVEMIEERLEKISQHVLGHDDWPKLADQRTWGDYPNGLKGDVVTDTSLPTMVQGPSDPEKGLPSPLSKEGKPLRERVGGKGSDKERIMRLLRSLPKPPGKDATPGEKAAYKLGDPASKMEQVPGGPIKSLGPDKEAIDKANKRGGPVRGTVIDGKFISPISGGVGEWPPDPDKMDDLLERLRDVLGQQSSGIPTDKDDINKLLDEMSSMLDPAPDDYKADKLMQGKMDEMSEGLGKLIGNMIDEGDQKAESQASWGEQDAPDDTPKKDWRKGTEGASEGIPGMTPADPDLAAKGGIRIGGTIIPGGAGGANMNIPGAPPPGGGGGGGGDDGWDVPMNDEYGKDPKKFIEDLERRIDELGDIEWNKSKAYKDNPNFDTTAVHPDADKARDAARRLGTMISKGSPSDHPDYDAIIDRVRGKLNGIAAANNFESGGTLLPNFTAGQHRTNMWADMTGDISQWPTPPGASPIDYDALDAARDAHDPTDQLVGARGSLPDAMKGTGLRFKESAYPQSSGAELPKQPIPTGLEGDINYPYGVRDVYGQAPGGGPTRAIPPDDAGGPGAAGTAGGGQQPDGVPGSTLPSGPDDPAGAFGKKLDAEIQEVGTTQGFPDDGIRDGPPDIKGALSPGPWKNHEFHGGVGATEPGQPNVMANNGNGGFFNHNGWNGDWPPGSADSPHGGNWPDDWGEFSRLMKDVENGKILSDIEFTKIINGIRWQIHNQSFQAPDNVNRDTMEVFAQVLDQLVHQSHIKNRGGAGPGFYDVMNLEDTMKDLVQVVQDHGYGPVAGVGDEEAFGKILDHLSGSDVHGDNIRNPVLGQGWTNDDLISAGMGVPWDDNTPEGQINWDLQSSDPNYIPEGQIGVEDAIPEAVGTDLQTGETIDLLNEPSAAAAAAVTPGDATPTPTGQPDLVPDPSDDPASAGVQKRVDDLVAADPGDRIDKSRAWFERSLEGAEVVHAVHMDPTISAEGVIDTLIGMLEEGNYQGVADIVSSEGVRGSKVGDAIEAIKDMPNGQQIYNDIKTLQDPTNRNQFIKGGIESFRPNPPIDPKTGLPSSREGGFLNLPDRETVNQARLFLQKIAKSGNKNAQKLLAHGKRIKDMAREAGHGFMDLPGVRKVGRGVAKTVGAGLVVGDVAEAVMYISDPLWRAEAAKVLDMEPGFPKLKEFLSAGEKWLNPMPLFLEMSPKYIGYLTGGTEGLEYTGATGGWKDFLTQFSKGPAYASRQMDLPPELRDTDPGHDFGQVKSRIETALRKTSAIKGIREQDPRYFLGGPSGGAEAMEDYGAAIRNLDPDEFYPHPDDAKREAYIRRMGIQEQYAARYPKGAREPGGSVDAIGQWTPPEQRWGGLQGEEIRGAESVAGIRAATKPEHMWIHEGTPGFPAKPGPAPVDLRKSPDRVKDLTGQSKLISRKEEPYKYLNIPWDAEASPLLEQFGVPAPPPGVPMRAGVR